MQSLPKEGGLSLSEWQAFLELLPGPSLHPGHCEVVWTDRLFISRNLRADVLPNLQVDHLCQQNCLREV